MSILSQLRRAIARVTGLFTGSRRDEELRAELDAHLEMATAENIRRGMAPDEARRHALIASGGLTVATEAVRDQRGLPWLDGAIADLRYAARSLRHARGFTAIVVVTLALGIGMNTAIFSVVRGVLLKPLPNRDGDRLVYLRQSAEGLGRENLDFSVPEVRDIRTGVPSFGGVAEYSPWNEIYQSARGAERVNVGLVTGNYFEVMGLSPILGRLTIPGTDDGPGAPPVAVLTHDYWMNRFGGDPTIVGKQITLDKKSVTVVGVLQAAPSFPQRVDLFANMVNSQHHLSAQMTEGRVHRMTEIVARLRPGATLRQARTEVTSVYSRLQQQYKEAYDPKAHFRVTVTPFKSALGERARLTVLLLMAAAAFVLVIAVANVANLTLMRGVRREHELVVRAALGAGVSRLRRLLLAENLLLTLLGSALGVAIALGGVQLLVSFAARYSSRAGEIQVDGIVLGFMLALSLGVALLLSYLAALPREGRLAAWILAGSQRTSGSLRKHRLQRGLVVVQIAVSVVLLAGAGLLTRTMIQLADIDTGLRTEEVLTMEVNLLTPNELLSKPGADAAAKVRYEEMRRQIATLPGVTEVGLGYPVPLRGAEAGFDVKAEGKTIAVGEPQPHASLRTADPRFFRAAGIPLLAGRQFDPTDGPQSAKVVIVNQTLVSRLFPNENPIGKRLAWTGELLKYAPIGADWRTIVGIVGNTRDGRLEDAPDAVVYEPVTQMFAIGGGFVIRADSDVAKIAPAAMRVVRQLAPTAPIEHVMTISQIKDESVAPRRLNAALVSSFGLLAVIIAAVGIAGVLAFSVSARTNEIGIRMSLGADSGRVQRMILGEGGVLLVTGLALGIAGALAAASVIRGLLFGVAPHDPITFAGVALFMALIGLVACWIPALRAARIDPVNAMRAS